MIRQLRIPRVLASKLLMPSGKLQVVPLGGLGEFGMNCMAIRWGDDIIVIDAGLMFPEAELLGVDIVVPDITYLTENREHVRGIVLTHGHEDHIGALPWILSELNVPVYGTEFTLAYVEGKLEEHGLLDDAELNEIARRALQDRAIHHQSDPGNAQPGGLRGAGHSYAAGRADPHRRFQGRSDADRQQAVRPACLCGVRKTRRAGAFPGFDQRGTARLHTERTRGAARVRRDFHARRSGDLFVSCFSSSIHRIKLTMELAFEHGRKVAFVGRSMMESSEIAQDLGYIDTPEGLIIHPAT